MNKLQHYSDDGDFEIDDEDDESIAKKYAITDADLPQRNSGQGMQVPDFPASQGVLVRSSSATLAGLNVYGDDEEVEEEERSGYYSGQQPNAADGDLGQVSNADYMDLEDDESGNSSGKLSPLTSSSMTQNSKGNSNLSTNGSWEDSVQLPPEPTGRCSNSLQDKIVKLLENQAKGRNLNRAIWNKKEFRNPSIYEKLVSFCSINENGTNFKQYLFNPNDWTKESFYDDLARQQNAYLEKREKEKLKRSQIEFTNAAKLAGTLPPSSGSTDHISDDSKKRSKWDAPIVIPSTAGVPQKIPEDPASKKRRQ